MRARPATALLTTVVSLVLALTALAPAAQAAPTAAPAAVPDSPPSARAAYQLIVLGGVKVRLPRGSTQVVTVNRTRGHHARVVLWNRWPARGWTRTTITNDGRIGYGGLVMPARRKQGTGTTPLGTWRLLGTFGQVAKKASWDAPYRRIRNGDYWVQDNASRHYNRYRNKAGGGFRWWLRSGPNSSERLKDYRVQYEMAVNTSFNRNQVRYRGAGIFLHVNGRGATAGCISVPRLHMRRIMASLDPARTPVIAIGR